MAVHPLNFVVMLGMCTEPAQSILPWLEAKKLQHANLLRIWNAAFLRVTVFL